MIAKAELEHKLSRCLFDLSEVKLLGHVATENGFTDDPGMTAALKDPVVQKTTTKLCSSPELAGFHQRFTRRFC